MSVRRRVAIVALALALGGCGPANTPSSGSAEPSDSMSPDRAADTVGLVVLVGRVGDMRLEHLGDGGGIEMGGPPNVPDPDARWVSGDRARGLVLTVGLAGQLMSKGPYAGEASAEWRRVAIRTPDGAPPRHPLAFATLSPDGRRIAAIAADMDGGGGDAQLAVIARESGEAMVHDLHGSSDGRPPVWLAEDLIAIPVRDATDRTALTHVRLPGGEASTLAVQSGAFAASVDGSIVALQTRGDQRIVAGSRDDLEAGRPLEVVRTDLDGNPLAAQLLLDARGDRLAGRLARRRRRYAGDYGLRARTGRVDDAPSVGRAGRGEPRRPRRLRSVSRRRAGQAAAASRGRGFAQAVASGCVAVEKIETCASSGSMTPMIFWRVRRWTQEPQLSK